MMHRVEEVLGLVLGGEIRGCDMGQYGHCQGIHHNAVGVDADNGWTVGAINVDTLRRMARQENRGNVLIWCGFLGGGYGLVQGCTVKARR